MNERHFQQCSLSEITARPKPALLFELSAYMAFLSECQSISPKRVNFIAEVEFKFNLVTVHSLNT